MNFEDFCNQSNLKKAFAGLKNKPTSFGVDKMKMETFFKNLDNNIQLLSDSLANETFNFFDAKGVAIPKPNTDEHRIIAVSTISNRVVLKALSDLLSQKFAKKIQQNQDISFAYQKGKNIWDALKKIKEYYKEGYTWAFETDIKDFFGSVNNNKIIKSLEKYKFDKKLIELLKKGLHQKIDVTNIPEKYHHKFINKNPEKGILQGSPLSPILSNLYLSKFDEYIKNRYKLVRYADDLVVLCKNEEEAHKAYADVQQQLHALELEIYPLNPAEGEKVKTRILQISPQTPLTFLSISFDGTHSYPSEKAIESLKQKIKEYTQNKSLSVLDMLNKVNNALWGWFQAYKHASNLNTLNFFEEVDRLINELIFASLEDKKWTLLLRGFNKKDKASLTKKHRVSSGIKLCAEIAKEVQPKK